MFPLAGHSLRSLCRAARSVDCGHGDHLAYSHDDAPPNQGSYCHRESHSRPAHDDSPPNCNARSIIHAYSDRSAYGHDRPHLNQGSLIETITHTPSPVPSPDCPVSPTGSFLEIWSSHPDLQSTLGCPFDPHPRLVPATWQVQTAYQPEVSGLGTIDWDDVAENLQEAKVEGRLAAASLPHGHTFLLLQSLRGYENVIYDMADAEPRLYDLIQVVETLNLSLVRRYVDLGAEWIGYPEDLGMQNGPMLSPEHFRRYIKPVYQRLMQPAREANCVVHMHSDGDIRALVDDLIEGGVQVINLQDLVNGIDWIAARFAGQVCVDLDVDRQTITRFGTPTQIDALIYEEVTKLGRKEGGLMMVYGLYPGVPIENIEALMDAMTRYAAFYS